ncbi:hypothetical protein AB0J83_09565 [Actinoplanes sp. NPDC049596]|uniref:hypothetical protein n=1 Tax=unclassified Actinoplanes TaxID=2626549 RepID=UPI003431C94B
MLRRQALGGIVVVSPVCSASTVASAAQPRPSSCRPARRLASAQTRCRVPGSSAPPGRPVYGSRAPAARVARASPRSWAPQPAELLEQRHARRQLGHRLVAAVGRGQVDVEQGAHDAGDSRVGGCGPAVGDRGAGVREVAG